MVFQLMSELLPLFLKLSGRRVLLVGGGNVAASKLQQLLTAGADVLVVAPKIDTSIERSDVRIERRTFEPRDLEGIWLVVAAATPDANREVAAAAEERRIFVNAVDDPDNASAYLSGVVRRDGVTVAISTRGAAPALAGLLRQAFDALLPRDLALWISESRRQRTFWRRDAVPMEQRRPLLLEALNDLYGADEPAGPFVSLVGGGPGDPSLLTRKGAARLRAADLVLYDALVDERVLALASRAQKFFVGKRARRHAMTQEAIHALMIRAARRGKKVVRLKGGDPFVFGRGGEEALALRTAGVPFEVVPGISSAVAAPALAGIPVTHRGLASAFFVVGGHDVAAFASSIAGLSPDQATLVILMGRSRSAEIGRELIARGWARTCPAAIVTDASRPEQHVWRGTVDDLAAGRVNLESEGAATIVVGAVVSLAARLGAQDEEQHVSYR